MMVKRKVTVSYNRLKEVLAKRKTTLQDLCREKSLNYETIRQSLVKGEIMPKYITVFPEYLHCPSAYLTGEAEWNNEDDGEADMVQVIRCKNCMYRKTYDDINGTRYICTKHHIYKVSLAEYCSWAEEKKNGHGTDEFV